MTLMQTDKATASTIEQVLISGDLSRLTAEQRNTYYQAVCSSLGLNPLTRPFEYIVLNGKLTLYARKDCTDQLRKLNSVSIRIVSRETVDGVCIVTAQATDKFGRVDESTGAVSLGNLRGEALANCWMKSETKAKRRVTLSICGLGFTDESEVDSIPNARVGESAIKAVDHLIPATPTVAQPVQAPAEEPESFETIDVASVEEHPTKSGSPCWKVVTKAGGVFAVVDPIVCEDISRFRADGLLVRVEVERKGKSRVIISADGVSE